MNLKKCLSWPVPAALALAGAVVYFDVSGCGFLGIVLFGLAGICAVFGGLTLWQNCCPKPAGRIKLGLGILLAILALAAVITLIPILHGPETEAGSGDYVIVLGAGVRGSEPSEILQDRIDVQADGGAWYPESMEAWSRGIVIRQGTYVGMIASAEHQDEIAEAFNRKFQ